MLEQTNRISFRIFLLFYPRWSRSLELEPDLNTGSDKKVPAPQQCQPGRFHLVYYRTEKWLKSDIYEGRIFPFFMTNRLAKFLL